MNEAAEDDDDHSLDDEQHDRVLRVIVGRVASLEDSALRADPVCVRSCGSRTSRHDAEVWRTSGERDGERVGPRDG